MLSKYTSSLINYSTCTSIASDHLYKFTYLHIHIFMNEEIYKIRLYCQNIHESCKIYLV